jgi:hypothetical protein
VPAVVSAAAGLPLVRSVPSAASFGTSLIP